MRDTWIDEHTGDELAARPAFEAELRAELARELGQPARLTERRRTPWRAIAWASVAAAAVVTTVVVVGNDDDKKVGPAVPATSTTVESTNPSTGDPTTVIKAADVVGPIWAILSRDGSEIRPELLAAFRFVSDGPIAGFDNCNSYGIDGWTLDANTVTPAGVRGSTAVLCDPMYPAFNPFTDTQPTTLEFGADRNHLTLTGANGVYEAVRLDEATQVTNSEVLGKWLATQRTSSLTITEDGLTLTPFSGTALGDPTSLYLVEGQLFLVSAGTVRVFETLQTGVDEADLFIPAEGGPLLAPEIVATLDVPAGSDYSRVAILPDRFAIAEVRDGRFSGMIISFDRQGLRLPDTTLDVARGDSAGVVLGGLDGTLYMETFPEVENTQTTTAYVLDGTVWRSVDAYFVEENNDASYQVTGDGLVLGSSLVIPAQTPVEDGVTAAYRPMEFGVAGFDIVRTPANGEPTTWRVVEDFDNFGLPPLVYPFGDGAIFVGNQSGIGTEPYLAVLRGPGPNEFLRLNGWEFAAADYDTALFSQLVDGKVQLGVLNPTAELAQINWTAGTVLDFPMGFSSVDKLLTGVNPMLGEPTADSGWFIVEAVAPGDEDCLAGVEMRVLHWGDLSVAFKKANTSEGIEGELLWSWVVGDLRGSGFDSYREPVPAPTGSPTGLLTESGIGVGSSLDQLRADGDVVLSDFTNTDGTRGGFFTPTVGTDGSSSRSFVIDADGVIIGFGTTQSFC
ncbi:MAG: hypothetical protein ABMA25_06400 [Ilumatobacteraceae bacterium]